jgi:hypothetical protein
MSKLGDFLTKSKIDPRRVLAVSAELEKLRPDDRAVRLAEKRVHGGKATDAQKETAAKDRRSGKPVTRPTLDAALKGDAISRKARQRIAAAVNHLLEKKKRDQVEVRDLF